MQEFFMTIKRDNQIIDIFNKTPIQLDTSRNIVEQAENFLSKHLGSLGIDQEKRSNFSWKIFKKQSNGYGMVTISRNWKE